MSNEQVSSTANNSPQGASEVLTVLEAAELFKVCGRDFREAFLRGEIPGGRRVGPHYRFHRERLLQWLGEASGAPSERAARPDAGLPAQGREEPTAQNETTVSTGLDVNTELSKLNRILRANFGARRKVTLESSAHEGRETVVVRWAHLTPTPRHALTRAARRATANDTLEPDVRCSDLEQAAAFLAHVSEGLVA